MENDPVILPDEQYRKHKRTFHRGFVFFLVLFLLGVAFWAGYTEGQGKSLSGAVSDKAIAPEDAVFLNKESQDNTIDFSLFWKVWGILREKYVDKSQLDSKKLFYGAIDGMLAATGDPYTTFFSPEENQSFKEDISGTFEGIGAEMGMKDDIITVIAPLEGAPAEKAGIRAGDKILKINGESTAEISLDEAVKKIRGPKGSEVTLSIFREGDDEAHDIAVKRDVIVVKSVRFEMKDNGIAYIKLSRFGDDSEDEFDRAVQEAKRNNPKGLILDLRNNPGGYLEGAVHMGSAMLPANKVVVMEENGKGERKEMKTRGGDQLSQLKTVVLINQGSASASEILAGALRENRDNVTLVGSTSFGKGSVQELVAVTRDTSVKITVARWLTPQGNQINKVGIKPDIEVKVTREDIEAERDPELEKALELFR